MIAPRSFFLVAIVVVLALIAAEVDADKAPRSPGRQLQMKMGKATKSKGGKSTKSPAPPEPDCDFVCECVTFFLGLLTQTANGRRLQANECDPDVASDQFAKFRKEAVKGLHDSGLFTPSQEKVVDLVAPLLPLMIDPCQFNDIAQFFLHEDLEYWLGVGEVLVGGLEGACDEEVDRARRLVTDEEEASQVNSVKGFIVAFFDPAGKEGYVTVRALLYRTVQFFITLAPVTGFLCNDGAPTENGSEYQYQYQEECMPE
mmetsp:Transcript_18718/g.44366  ORF Transcript_18718/g.44366 Transcript_18718/m.44366 type:complete len:258 (+) Transcript_18718:100-873(+)|eukprot:CAMPEP_0185812992 /NCGR_PEP_ID=MMETSP1322-20130828/10536_1 /TAXON_ID=265543 /ORGANISM="Minutocellus polymorphus, Strain RCC2270" /LENGTH=257 /DNA_ID=CAMNT_0028509607 /DNA_START=66 /DNA_END=839 /DNA_ORIENTATION=+